MKCQERNSPSISKISISNNFNIKQLDRQVVKLVAMSRAEDNGKPKDKTTAKMDPEAKAYGHSSITDLFP